ncbi:eCIS core domain-containing protein [Streptomyces kebangsaanensis]|uniref:eCIS core domain-containing protein n=1 Tax=Streptomyces kebangsaanensis TaxID=864058 RepID=UPI001F3A8A16|nr:DUF4157 domain-containing protein [Streptomyces kebangsaanensis]
MVADQAADEQSAMTKVEAVTRAAGSPLRADVQHAMEQAFGGEDFSDVRVHVDRGSAEAVGAKAYTTKTNHIVFRSAADMDAHTVRHELQHVRQQRAGGVPSGVSHPEDALERDAESTATRLGHGAPDVQRVPASPHHHAPAPAGTGTVQRVKLTDPPFWQAWAGPGARLTSEQKTFVWQTLGALAKERHKLVRTLSVQEAVDLLKAAEVTPESLAEHMARQEQQARDRYPEEAQDTVAAAAAKWEAQDPKPELPLLETVAFDIEGMGRGTIALLKRRGQSPSYPKMLSWFSHGYEDRHPITIDTARKYAFAVREEQSLDRTVGTVEDWKSLPGALDTSDIKLTTSAPGEYVQPHSAFELKQQIDRVISLVEHCDVAVLLDYHWAGNVAEEHAGARAADTPALATIIERTPKLARYESLLIYACRTPWSVNSAAEGSSLLKAQYAKELKAAGKSVEEAEAMVKARYTGGPTKGVVHR